MSRPPLRLPELSELVAIVAAAEEGSLAGAARRLHLTGPAVAKRVGNLETIFGVQLLERSERGVRPTPSGRDFVAAARRLLADVEDLLPSLPRAGQADGLDEGELARGL